MGLVRRILRSDAAHRLICGLIAGYIGLIHRTTRWQVIGGEFPNRYWDQDRPFILAFWHGRLLMLPVAWRRGRYLGMLISGHRDGRIIGDAVAYYGLTTITGSRTKGGMAALRTMVRTLTKDGQSVGITPDGPRGPAMHITPGIVATARLSGSPIIPFAYATRWRRILGTWDSFHLPLPFGRGVFLWGEPIFVPPDADEATQDALLHQVETAMIALTQDADRRCGHPPVEPAPPHGVAPHD